MEPADATSAVSIARMTHEARFVLRTAGPTQLLKFVDSKPYARFCVRHTQTVAWHPRSGLHRGHEAAFALRSGSVVEPLERAFRTRGARPEAVPP
jgi:hypothetical protein